MTAEYSQHYHRKTKIRLFIKRLEKLRKQADVLNLSLDSGGLVGSLLFHMITDLQLQLDHQRRPVRDVGMEEK